MAERDVTIDILARDKTDRATRSAARNFETLKRKTDKAIDAVGDSVGSRLVKKLAPLGALLTKPLVAGIAAGAPAIAAAVISAASLGLGAGLIGIGALALKENAKLQKAFEKTTTGIKSDMAKAAQPLLGPFMKALGSIRKLSAKLAPDFRAMFRAVAPIVPLMTKVFSGVVAEVVHALKDSMPAVNAAFRGLASALPTVGKWIGQFIRTLLANPAVIENTTKALTLLAAGPLKILGPLLNGLNVLFGAQVNFVRLYGIIGGQLWPKLIAWFDGGSGAVKRLKEAWGPLWTAIKNVWDKLKEFAAAKTDKDIVTKFAALVKAVKDTWGPLKNFIGTVWAEAWAFVKRKWDEVVVPWWNNTAKPWLKKALSGAMDEACELMKQKATAKLKQLPGAMIAALAGLAGRLIDRLRPAMGAAGASIGSAFVNAMISAINAGRGRIVGVGSSVGRAGAAAAKAAAANFSTGSWAPARTAAQFGAAGTFAASGGGGRAGGPLQVEQTLNVLLDGQPFYSYVDRAVAGSQRRAAWRDKVGRR